MELKTFAKAIRLNALEMALRTGKKGSHLGGGLSAVEIFAALYGKVMNFSADNRYDEERDRLVVSKGHCVLAYYSALYFCGLLTKADLDGFEVDGSHLHGHAFRNIDKGIEFSGGSLSMGMSFAVGQALACKKKNIQNRVFTIVGDGECDEGLIWEAAMAAGNFHLNNFTVIVDRNHLQYDGETKDVMDNSSLCEKFRAFGFDAYEVDGHSVDALVDALGRQTDKPLCVVANTVKGKGVSFMEGQREWHHHVLTEEEYLQAKSEVEQA